MTTRFLIADRDAHVREGCRMYLTARGFDAETAADGVQCIERIHATEPTVLVLDADLLWGGCDGVLEWLHDQPSGIHSIVLLSESRPGRFLPRGLRGRIAGQLDRPHNLHELEEFINRLEDTVHEHCAGCPQSNPLATDRVYA